MVPNSFAPHSHPMSTFSSSREAKEFLITRIFEEARRTGTPLSELERQMLWFTETEPTPIDVYAVNEAFVREYDTAEYEDKIARLIVSYRTHAAADDLARWKEAVRTLRSEDHYLLVMIDIADAAPGPIQVSISRVGGRPLYIFLVGIALAVVACGFFWIALWIRNSLAN